MTDTEKDALRAENMDLRAKLDAIEQAEGLPDLLAKYTQACVRNDALREALAESDGGLNYMHLYDDDTPKEAKTDG